MTDQIEEKLASLTQRQKEVMRLIARHYRDKEIARILNISEHTARAHADAVRDKLGGISRREAARFLSDHADVLGIPPEREYQSSGIAQTGHEPSSCGHPSPIGDTDDHPHASLDAPLPTVGHDAVGAHRDRAQIPGSAREGASDQRDAFGDPAGIPNHAGEARLYPDLSLRLAHGRDGVHGWLAQLNLLQWTLLTLGLTLCVVLIIGGVMGALIGIFQAIRELSGQTG
ncbi:helix-turn-helix domain-containing protein [Asticcacaulis excentricus]|uniref:helix-turn-helix domain-containing protein n=1 Tax=Asticcacaulis excentricus TaxID=78587 RepID=UPI000F83E79B|nr:helix-turn-helix transcriptional regulator [Asticcacaulis excentricus]